MLKPEEGSGFQAQHSADVRGAHLEVVHEVVAPS